MATDIHQQLIEKVRTYQMPKPAVRLLSEHPPLLLAGPTGSGKNTLSEYLEDGRGYMRVITHTTRPPREGEVHAKHYHFVGEEEMMRLLKSESMVEAKAIHGESVYGISIAAYEQIIKEGNKPILTIEVQGIDEITKGVHKLRPIFILPPSFRVWMERLNNRGAMTHNERHQRLRTAKTELSEVLRNDNYILLVNHDVPQTASEIIKGVTDHSKQHQNKELIKELLEEIQAY